MPTWAPNTAQVIDNGFGGSRNGNAVNGVVPHHTGSVGNSLNYVANWNDRDSHPTYHIDRSGKVSGVVHPDRRPYSTYPGSIDLQAVTFEIDNITGAPDWRVADVALEAFMETTWHHYTESPRFGNGFALNKKGETQREFFIGWHAQYRAVECPGPYILNRLNWIVDTLNARDNGQKVEVDMANNFGAVIRTVEGHAYLQTANGRAHIMTPNHRDTLESFHDGQTYMYQSQADLIQYYYAIANTNDQARHNELVRLIKSLKVPEINKD